MSDARPSPMDARRSWAALTRARAQAEEAPAARIAVAATFTVDPLVPYLGNELHALGGGTAEITVAPYDQVMQLCFDWRGTIGQDVDTIVVLWRIEDLLRADFQAVLRGDAGATDRVNDRVDELIAAVAQLRTDFPGAIIVSVPPYPHGPDADIRHMAAVGQVGRLHRTIIQRWIGAVEALDNVQLLDLDGLQRHAGIVHTLDHRKWYLYRQPFTEAFWSDIGAALGRLVAQQRIAAKKCLVLDCDNTLWGGIVGEDGPGGIHIGDDFPGSAFRDFQHYLLTLRAQGVMLAVCSKNNEADAWEVFDGHDRMVLKREHLAAHRVNWQDKPSNLVEIAKELNIGLDSMVFVDDSLMEVNHVREALPMVTTVLVPSEVAALPAAIAALRLFDRLSVTDEDRARNDMMAQERDRRETGRKAVSKEEFIRSLELDVTVAPITPRVIERATQLVNKTNQFNLTTRRRDGNEMAALVADPAWIALALHARDRFGDYGLIGICLAQLKGATAAIDTLLMSCRVLGRNVEEAFLAAVAEAARRGGAAALVGTYVPSAKNQMVATFYPDRGFLPTREFEWMSDIQQIAPWPDYIRGGLQ